MRQRMLAFALVLVCVGMAPAWAAELNLSAEQKAKWESLQNQHQPAMQQLRQEIASQQRQLQAVFSDPKASPEQVRAVLQAWAAMKGKKAQREADHLFDLHRLLSPEQRKIYIQETF